MHLVVDHAGQDKAPASVYYTRFFGHRNIAADLLDTLANNADITAAALVIRDDICILDDEGSQLLVRFLFVLAGANLPRRGG